MTKTSPFKFLDSYQKDDLDIFFGREKETEKLYDALRGVKHLLVFGPSGAGKSSLIECGLRNQFYDADWFALTVRRGGDLNAAVFARIREQLREPFDLDPATKLPADPNFEFGDAVERLFAEQYKPVYLLFDQFEELLIQGSDAEKQAFFTHLQRLIRYKVPCRVLLVMREEFIGHLSEFEPLCPSIFQHRFRLEKMGRSNVQSVIQQILEAEKYQSDFRVEQPETLAKSILAKLPDTQREIELAHVQVFLEELWDRATAENKTQKPVLHSGLVQEEDNLERVLDSFLKKQLEQLEQRHGEKVPMELLAAMISERHTKLQMSAGDLENALAANAVPLVYPVPDLLRDLEQRRIVRTLKSGEETQFEISHDVLALVVGQNLTNEMKLREKAREVYRVYEGRAGMFSREDLDYLRAFEGYLGVSEGLKKRIEESEGALKATFEAEKIEIEQRRRRALWTAAVASVLILVAVGASVFAFQKMEQARIADEKATVATQKADYASDLAEQRDIQARVSENIAKERNDAAISARRQADNSKKLAELKTKEAKTAADLAEIKKLEAEKAEIKAKTVLGKIYFYNDRFGLAFDQTADYGGYYGYIDKKLNVLINFDYDEALPFELETGLAKVWRYNTALIIDTTINEYLLGKGLTSLYDKTQPFCLDLRDNYVEGFPDSLWEYQNIEILLFDADNMRSSFKGLDKLRKLKKLYVRKYKKNSLPDQVYRLTSLDVLVISGYFHPVFKRRFGLDSLSQEIGNLKNLKSLTLNVGKITTLPLGLFSLKQLEALNLSANRIENLPPEVGLLQNLRSLNLGSNKINSLPPNVRELKKMQALYLDSNNFKIFPSEIEFLSNLQILDLHSNDLKSLPLTKLEKLTQLKKCFLYGNPLKEADIQVLRNAMPWCEFVWWE